MHWLNKRARFKDQFSPYLDGALSSTEIATLEAHLGSCEACRAELDELRATVAATRQLPQVDAPRSFALTPEILEGRRPATAVASAPPLALGMRLASAGVAVVLAVVVIGDLSDGGGGGGGAREVSDELGASRTTAEFAIEAEGDKTDSGAAAPAPDATGAAEGNDAEPPAADATSGAANDNAACPAAAAGTASGATTSGGAAGPASTDGAGAGGVGGVGGPVASPDATPIPQPPAVPTPANRVETDTVCEEQPAAAAVAPTTSASEPEPAGDVPAEPPSADGALEAEDDGGVSTLRVIEVVLAAALAALIAGVVVETVRRRRAA
jgi:Putative zinc-finger